MVNANTQNQEHQENGTLSPADFQMYWTAQISPFMSSLLALCYTQQIEAKYRTGFNELIIFSNGSKSTCYLKDADRKRFAEYVISKFAMSAADMEKLCQTIKDKADELIAFCEETKDTFSTDTYYRFKELFLDYNFYHITPRHLADFLDPDKIKPYMGMLSETRIYVEKLHYGLDLFLADLLSNLLKTNREGVLHHTFEEIEFALTKNSELPKVLLNEFTDFCIIARKDSFEKLPKDKAVKVFSALNETVASSGISGTVAFKGKVIGRVKIVIDPSKVLDFREGDILVAEMTRPEYVPFMNLASAVVTDGGGMLCHAAIVARELKKPCIIGTKNATKVFKDGDMVEVDADKGVINIVK